MIKPHKTPVISEETETKRDEINQPKPQGQLVTALAFKHKLSYYRNRW